MAILQHSTNGDPKAFQQISNAAFAAENAFGLASDLKGLKTPATVRASVPVGSKEQNATSKFLPKRVPIG